MMTPRPTHPSFRGSLGPVVIAVYLALHAIWAQGAYGPYVFAGLRVFFLMGVAAWLVFRGHAQEIWNYLVGRIIPDLSPRQIIFMLTSIIAARLAAEALNPFPMSSAQGIWGECVIAPVNEEMVFRGLFLAILFQHMPHRPWAAIPVGALVYASVHHLAGHGAAVDVGYLAALLVLGGLLGWIYWKSGSVPFCILCHALWNFFAFVPLIQHR